MNNNNNNNNNNKHLLILLKDIIQIFLKRFQRSYFTTKKKLNQNKMKNKINLKLNYKKKKR